MTDVAHTENPARQATTPPKNTTTTTGAADHVDLAWLTIGEALRERASRTPDDVVVREKDQGVYRAFTWSQYLQDATAFAWALRRRGFRPGQHVAVMGDPTYRFMVADAGVILAGGVAFGIYTTCSPEEVRHQIRTAGATTLVAENQEYVDRFFEVAEDCPSVNHVVVDDTRALFGYDDARIEAFDDLLDEGNAATPQEVAEVHEAAKTVSVDDPAMLIFTSGTTGPSKAAMISHRNVLVGGALQLCTVFPELHREDEVRIVAHLSLAHAFERIIALYSPILSRIVVHTGEGLENLSTTLYEVQPNMFHAVPRVWQKFAAGAITRVERAGGLKQRAYQLAMRVAKRHRRSPSALTRFGYLFARLLVFRPMLRKFGLAKVRFGITGGTHIPPEVQRTWQLWGVNLLNALGMTEVGFIAFQTGQFPEPGSVGTPVPDIAVQVAEDHELLYRGPGVFLGYLNQPEKTEEVFEGEWFASGDVGEINDEGHLVLRDRKKDIMITAGGKNITPSLIENVMKASPYISELVLIADGRKFPTALVEIDRETVEDWARSNGHLYTSFGSLTRLPEVLHLIEGQIAKGNEELARVEQVKRFRIIPKELDPEEGDTTPTRKVRRGQFQKMFADLVEDMYAEEAAELARFS
ncbi:Long-chain-fatty-acid--CoA ligase [Euzebya pacifica]|uniref:Long-chain-fatty-acid--CoA ligase n=1 Tax=Euzebya pacifica TaxID=1608957 RepID=A0A346XWV8_9ACTN|nr:AMP-binding protein [Euzebya pacifica]AXV06705.1 Long-chain-fatty-acid--CoA ligase [Euzebya pacifica]